MSRAVPFLKPAGCSPAKLSTHVIISNPTAYAIIMADLDILFFNGTNNLAYGG